MKRISYFAVVIFALLFFQATVSSARPLSGSDTEISVVQVQSGQKKAIVRIVNIPDDRLALLTLRDAHGHVLHRQSISRSVKFFRGKYDFSTMPSGEYYAEVKTQDGFVTSTFTINPEPVRTPLFKPVVRAVPDTIKLAFQNTTAGSLSVQLRNQAGQCLYRTRVDQQETYQAGLDVSRLRSGEYKLTIDGKDYSYAKDLQW